MKPVAIFRHARIEGPGYFATFLEANSIPWKLIAIDAAEPLPDEPALFSGMVFMGGPMSVNDPLPWIDAECDLIREAVRAGIPVLGHCLGGQLMAKALGGQVSANGTKEIGWGEVFINDAPETMQWVGKNGSLCHPINVFHWHGETFSLPPGATHLMHSTWCANQMFSLGPHLAMQFHVEMTPKLIADWCENWEEEVLGLPALPPSVQTPAQIFADTARHLPGMRELADRIYGNWISRLERS